MRNKEKGLTLPELMISLASIVIVAAAAYYVLIFFQRSFLGQNIRMGVYTEMRGIISELEDKLSQAGVGLNLIHTDAFLGSQPAFNGILPLNNSEVNPSGDDEDPDGVIVAIGNVETLTKPSAPWHPSQSSLYIEKMFHPFTGQPLWNPGDTGIIIGEKAFYVFKVEAVDQAASRLQLRPEPVYYSGLLSVSDSSGPISYRYEDLLDDSQVLGEVGNNYTYSQKSAVMKLNFFGIYFIFYDKNKLFDSEPAYYLVLTTDAKGAADPCNITQPEADRCVPLAKNVVDMQIVYVSKDPLSPKQIFWAADGINSQDREYKKNPKISELLNNVFLSRTLTGIRVNLFLVTERFKEQPIEELILPAAGDRPEKSGIKGFEKKMLRAISTSVVPRNYLTVY